MYNLYIKTAFQLRLIGPNLLVFLLLFIKCNYLKIYGAGRHQPYTYLTNISGTQNFILGSILQILNNMLQALEFFGPETKSNFISGWNKLVHSTLGLAAVELNKRGL